ncbi:hypothetical protein Droror1_Dr00019790 [Drosera rotundifolia]
MMMRRKSPPKHRHDGTSPLPLGMDWSPPPKKWNGRDTIWPHDPHSGWSYCVMVPSWVALPKSKSSASDPVVFYRVQVAIQSPAGLTTTRGVLRRFNDFLKLYSDIKKAFPKRSILSAPPKGLLRMRSKELLEERRYLLEEWITRLLSDIDISRSLVVASFLELEAAARSSFQEANKQAEPESHPNGSISSDQHLASSSLSPLSASITSDYGSDTVYEASDLGTPSVERDDSSDAGIEELTFDEDPSNPLEKLVKYGMSNIDEGLLMGETILDQLEALPRNKGLISHATYNGNPSNAAFLSVSGMNALFEAAEPVKEIAHVRRLSNDSIGSDLGSYRGSEISNSGTPNLLSEASLDFSGGAETSRTDTTPAVLYSKLPNGTQLVIPTDQRSKLNRVLMIMQRRLVTAKTDMEDLITRLNQEITVKEYLTTKVKDLEGELETTKQKSKENLQQALLIEKERVMKMQWDMEELRRKSMEMELRLKSHEGYNSHGDNTSSSSSTEMDGLMRELNDTKEQLTSLLRQHEELEVKSKSDIKVLVKEVKSLRKSKNELQLQLAQSVEEKSNVEKLLQQERKRIDHALAARRKLIHECEILRSQLQECTTKHIKDGLFVGDSSSIPNILDVLTNSDNEIVRFLSEARSFKETDINQHENWDELNKLEDELRKMVGDVFIDNAMLRKQVNSFLRTSQRTGISPEIGTDGDGNDARLRDPAAESLSEP